jgi:hypothetical protein
LDGGQILVRKASGRGKSTNRIIDKSMDGSRNFILDDNWQLGVYVWAVLYEGKIKKIISRHEDEAKVVSVQEEAALALSWISL